MLRLDHFVIHIDPDMRALDELKRTLAPMGYPFEPRWGKGTRDFQVANLWVGRQYLEMVWLKRPDCRDWEAEWVPKYNAGLRGITAIMLLTDRLEATRSEFIARGLRVRPPRRTTFRMLFGLLTKSLPWRYCLVEPVPGTDLQIGLIEVDGGEDGLRRIERYMVPNAAQNGIDGIRTAIVRGPFDDVAWSFWEKLLGQTAKAPGRMVADLDEDTRLIVERDGSPAVSLELQATTDRPDLIGHRCRIATNVDLVTVPRQRREKGVA